MEAQAYLFTLLPCWSNKTRKCRSTDLHTFHVPGPSWDAKSSHICTYAMSLVLPCSSMGMSVNQTCGSQWMYVHNCTMSQCYHMSTQADSSYICCIREPPHDVNRHIFFAPMPFPSRATWQCRHACLHASHAPALICGNLDTPICVADLSKFCQVLTWTFLFTYKLCHSTAIWWCRDDFFTCLSCSSVIM